MSATETTTASGYTDAEDSRFYLMRPDTTRPFPAHPEPFAGDTWAVVDEEAGGVVAYVCGTDLADTLCTLLNRQASTVPVP